jgi:protein associated with RNAse G/E
VIGAEVRVVFRKYDGSLHWNFPMYRLGEDRYGTWLGAPKDTVMWRGEEAFPATVSDHVVLFPVGEWWTAVFNAEPYKVDIYCDVNTPPQWLSPAEVTMIDLDLDVLRERGGPVKIVDQDEFAEHQVRYRYPAAVIARAEAAADRLYAAISAGEEPFGEVGAAWLARVPELIDRRGGDR